MLRGEVDLTSREVNHVNTKMVQYPRWAPKQNVRLTACLKYIDDHGSAGNPGRATPSAHC